VEAHSPPVSSRMHSNRPGHSRVTRRAHGLDERKQRLAQIEANGYGRGGKAKTSGGEGSSIFIPADAGKKRRTPINWRLLVKRSHVGMNQYLGIHQAAIVHSFFLDRGRADRAIIVVRLRVHSCPTPRQNELCPRFLPTAILRPVIICVGLTRGADAGTCDSPTTCILACSMIGVKSPGPLTPAMSSTVPA